MGLVALAAVCFLGVAVIWQGQAGPTATREAGVVPPAESAPASPPGVAATALPTPSASPTPTAAPTPTLAPTSTVPPVPTVAAIDPPVSFTVDAPAIAVPVVSVATRTDGSLELPDSPDIGGWWAPGAAPGAAQGTVVIAGHVDTAAEGAGAFAQLWSVPIGGTVRVTSLGGVESSYVLEGRRVYGKAELPSDLFTGQGAPRLALVTCTGEYDEASRSYPENLVLYGVPVPAPALAPAP